MSDSDVIDVVSVTKPKRSRKRGSEGNGGDEPPCKKRQTPGSPVAIDDTLWTEVEIEKLMEAVEKQLPKGDRTYKQLQPVIDWKQITVGQHTAESCQKKLDFIISKVRKERSFMELINAAKSMNNNGRLLEYPEDMPRKPMPGFFIFFAKRLRRLKAKHPDWTYGKIRQQANNDYNKLSEKKKAKLKAEYDEKVLNYQKAMALWKEKHPELVGRIRCHNEAPRMTTPVSLYVASQSSKQLENDPTLSRSELKAKLKTKWKTLKDKKKYKYLNKAVRAKIQYDKDLEKYLEINPNYRPPRCRVGFLTIDEWKIKEKYDGKPETPPQGAFSLFVSENTEACGGDQAELNRRWRELSVAEKKLYSKRAKKVKVEYYSALKSFLGHLEEDERRVYEEHLNNVSYENKGKHLHKTKETQTTKENNDGDDDVDAFIKENRELYRSKYPTVTENALYSMMVKDYYKLPEKTREQYRRESSTSVKKTHNHGECPGLPSKPPSSGYQLFCSQLLKKTKDIPNKERMAFCAKEWKNADQEKYNKMCKKLTERYQTALKQYISEPPKDTAAELLESRISKKTKSSIEDLNYLSDPDVKQSVTELISPKYEGKVEDPSINLSSSFESDQSLQDEGTPSRNGLDCDSEQTKRAKGKQNKLVIAMPNRRSPRRMPDRGVQNRSTPATEFPKAIGSLSVIRFESFSESD